MKIIQRQSDERLPCSRPRLQILNARISVFSYLQCEIRKRNRTCHLVWSQTTSVFWVLSQTRMPANAFSSESQSRAWDIFSSIYKKTPRSWDIQKNLEKKASFPYDTQKDVEGVISKTLRNHTLLQISSLPSPPPSRTFHSEVGPWYVRQLMMMMMMHEPRRGIW